ncbi:MAG: hypothetical protein ACRC2Q_13025 [Cetobacterium sp.]
MKKIILTVAILGLVGCSNSKKVEKNSSPKMVGAYGSSKMDAMGEIALNKLVQEKKLGKNYKLIEYQKQIVAGINHKFILEINGKLQQFVVYESLNGKFTVK